MKIIQLRDQLNRMIEEGHGNMTIKTFFYSPRNFQPAVVFTCRMRTKAKKFKEFYVTLPSKRLEK